ncbi:amino acid ABC transporter permease [Phytohabitans suffuscus]|uniref:Putative amino acid ABC transporter, permease protein n=1 Tax=Phytohabitans suffuscus TaxID=624315 RepID=A0A6F8YCX7_9ACTN|nr:amino acid ABC transporter permease [Phytohabitans suffuscus]BCB83811.1 putative amino acid ABC transporter, permease protein [Phytohabitans suffuscus]
MVLDGKAATAAPGTADPHHDPPDHDPAALRVVPARHPGRWIASTVAAVLLAMALHALVTNPAWEWHVVSQYLFYETVLRAVGVTLQLTALGILLGFALGTVLALMRLSQSPLLQAFSWGYVWLFRSVPLILQLLFWFNLALLYDRISFGIPFGPSFWDIGTQDLIGPLTAATLGLALHQAAYCAEIVRSGFLSVDQGQLEAAAALGLPRHRQIRRILLPQAMRTIIPTAGNEIIGLVKGTSVVYIMAIPELFYQVQVIYSRNGRVIALLLVAAIWYLLLTTVLSIAQFYVERYYARGAVRVLPPTPWQRVRAAVARLDAARRQRRADRDRLAAQLAREEQP